MTTISKSEAAKLVRTRMNELLTRASTDVDFRAQLVAQPRAAVSQFFGVELPESFRVAFVENKADATFVLPEPTIANAELAETELEAVAGGCTLLTASAIVASAAAVAKAYDTFEDRVCGTSCFDSEEEENMCKSNS